MATPTPPPSPPPPPMPWWRLYLRQTYGVSRKNLLVRGRSWRLNLAHALQSVFVIFLM